MCIWNKQVSKLQSSSNPVRLCSQLQTRNLANQGTILFESASVNASLKLYTTGTQWRSQDFSEGEAIVTT